MRKLAILLLLLSSPAVAQTETDTLPLAWTKQLSIQFSSREQFGSVAAHSRDPRDFMAYAALAYAVNKSDQTVTIKDAFVQSVATGSSIPFAGNLVIPPGGKTQLTAV